MDRQTLAIRKTHTYVGSYDHLDSWEDIGSFARISHESVSTDEEDACDPHSSKTVVAVESDSPREEIREALLSSFTKAGCAHEYDCCGCRSFYAREATPVGKGMWCVEVDSRRNY